MRSIDAACCYTHCCVVCLCVCVYVTGLNLAKTAESIEMLFGIWARVGPHNHVLDGGPTVRGSFGGGHAWVCLQHFCVHMFSLLEFSDD